MRSISLEEVSKHNTDKDAWIILGDKVYDITKFAPVHPGGKKVLLNYAGKDGSDIFNYFHHKDLLLKY